MNAVEETLLQKLTIILQRSLVEVRNLALNARCEQIYDLADAVEILPSLIVRADHAQLAIIRDALAAYQSKYRETAYDYLSILDMEETAFREVYLSSECLH
jgi:hypothetical protein